MRALRRGLKWLGGQKEALGYYAVLAVVLAALGTAAYGHRGGSVREAGSPTATADAARAVQAAPEPTPAPEEEAFLAPVPGEVLAGYAANEPVWSETLGQWQTHPAVDFAAADGEAVVAAADGVVLEAYSDPLYGNVVAIDCGEGVVVRYASLNTLQLVEVGREVSRGDILSAAGRCEAEAELGAHVHMEVLVDGAPDDPAAWLEGE